MKQLFLALFIILCSACTSCQPFDFDVARGDVARAKLEQEYQKSFSENFGKYGVLNIDETHNWGFTSIVDSSFTLTRAANVNANQWLDFGLDVPKPLTNEQINVVSAWFKTHKNPTGISINWTEYFAQQVSSTNYGRNMDYLVDAGTTGHDHVNNFNSGNCSETNITNDWKDRIMFMSGQSTKDFSYHETVSNKTWEDHYVIIPGEIIDPNNSHGLHGMYFLGFDYEAKGQSANQIIPRDYYFNDWIIKLTPGLLIKPEPVRIMAEDLGAIGDFDFNDVVFDVYLKYNANYGIIVLKAAGGTMPLYVNDMQHEVHELFGVDTTQIVNTQGDKSVDRPEVIWSFTPISNNPIDIPIKVDNTREHIWVTIGAERGVAPGKFAVPTTVQWSPECVNIKTTYPKFPLWVEDANNKFWE